MSVLSQSLVMNPSGLLHVRGSTNPAVVCDYNFQRWLSHIGGVLGIIVSVTNADPTDMEPDDAPAAVQANFDAINSYRTTLGETALPFLPVADSDNPEIAVQYNFELINSVW